MNPFDKTEDVKVKVAAAPARVDTMTLGLVVLSVVSIIVLLSRAASGI